MKNSFDHLPKSKQLELKKIVSLIRNLADIEMIILFGSYARGSWREVKDVVPDKPGFRRISDYDILVITEKKDKSRWHKIASVCQKLKLSALVRTEFHDIGMLNIKLAEGQYFFSDIKKEGIMLYDSTRFKLAKKRRLKPEEKQRIARDYFDETFQCAQDFFETYKFCFRTKRWNRAAFHLHQTAEHAYKTLHLVFTNYSPHEHFLSYLAKDVKHLHHDLKKLFPQKTKSQQDRFELLEEAYISGRYDMDFYMAKKDLEMLAKDVIRLLEIAEEICRKNVGSL